MIIYDPAANRARVETFERALTDAYAHLFAARPAEYGPAAATNTPATLAHKMAWGLAAGTAHHEGAGIRRACKALGIKPTRSAITAYLHAKD